MTVRNGHLTVAEAADELDVTEWDVLDLVRRGDIDSVTYVEARSLRTYKEERSA